jgi:hypothetical protein
MGNEYEPLADRIRAVFRRHIKQDNGIISAPEKLIDNTLVAVGEWLQHDEENWGDTEGGVAEALRDLRTNQLR